jgi:hypothetical protein
VLFTFRLNQLHAQRHVCIPSLFVHELLHSETNQNVLVVHSYCVFRVFIRKKDAYLALSNLASLETLIADGISVDIAY